MDVHSSKQAITLHHLSPQSVSQVLSTRLKSEAIAGGAATVGIAHVTAMIDDSSSARVCAIAFTLRYPDEQVERLPNDEGIREAIHQLGAISKRIYAALQRLIFETDTTAKHSGYDAVETIFGRFTCRLSQKAIAQQAGLGWIGKSSLLVTPQFGPRARLGTLFTDLPLASDAPFPTNECRDCRVCADVCPANAVTGQPFHFGPFLGYQLARTACEAHLSRHQQMSGTREFCGLCLKECPYGKRSSAEGASSQ